MKRFIKNIIVKILSVSGLPYFFREVLQKNKVTIITLHDPKPAYVEKYIKWLTGHYNIISLHHYLSYRFGKTNLPEKSMIITVDDGHIGNYKLLPLFQKAGLPVTIFLCSGIINTNRHFWFRYDGLKTDSELLKYCSNSKRLSYLAKLGFYQDKEFSSPQALTREQIQQMQKHVDFQGHTVFHPCLNRCTDEVAWKEIKDSKVQLESEYKLDVKAIAYPNGGYTKRELRFAKEAGYLCGLTVGFGFNGRNRDLFKLRRYSVGDFDSVDLLAVKSSGVWACLACLFKKIPGSIKYGLLALTGKLIRVFIVITAGMEDVSLF